MPHDDAVQCPAQADYEPPADHAELDQLMQHCHTMTATFQAMPHRHSTVKMVSESAEPPIFDMSTQAQAHVLTVDKWFEEIEGSIEGYATPRTMEDLQPMKDFRLQALDRDPREPEYGFEFALKKALDGLSAQAALHHQDWAPMVQEVVEQAEDIRREWPAGLGFETVNKFCMQVLSSGFVDKGQRNPDQTKGYCIERMITFFSTVIRLHKDMDACQTVVKDAADEVTKTETAAQKLDELNALAYEPSENKATWWADKTNVTRLVELLKEDFFNLGPFNADDEAAVAGMCDEFLQTVETKMEELDVNLLRHRQELMAARAKLILSVEKRVLELQGMLPTVEQKRTTMVSEAERLALKCAEYSKQASATICATMDKLNVVQQECEAAKEMRSQKRVIYAESIRKLSAENEELERTMREILAKVHSNEAQIRELTTKDKQTESQFQINIAAKSGDLGTLNGCQDEMHRLLVMVDESKAVVERTKRIGTVLLCDHAHSVKNNILKDVASTEKLGRETDTAHFETFCDAYMATMRIKIMMQHAGLETEKAIKTANAGIRQYQTLRNAAKVAEFRRTKEEQTELMGDQNTQISKVDLSMKELEDSLEPVVKRLGSLQKGRDDKLLQRIAEYVVNPPPTPPMAELECKVKGIAIDQIDLTTKQAEQQAAADARYFEDRKKQINEMPKFLTGGGDDGLTRQGSKASKAAIAKTVHSQQQRQIAEVEYHQSLAAAHQLGQRLGMEREPEPEPEAEEGEPPAPE